MTKSTYKDIEKINNICLITLTSVAITGALIYTRTVMVPFVIALCCYTSVMPFIRWMENNLKFPRGLSLTITLALVIVFWLLFFVFIVSSVQDFIVSAGIYKERIIAFADWIVARAALFGYQINFEGVQGLHDLFGRLPIMNLVKEVTGSLVGLLGGLILVTVICLFLILGEKHKDPEKSNKIVEEIQEKISKYLFVKGLMSLLTGFLVGLILWPSGVELLFMFVALSVILNFIPSVGSLIATVVPIPVLVLHFGLTWPFYTVLGLCMIVQLFIGNFLEPKLMGDSMDLHPVSILMMLIFWGLVWGIPGMFLAVPITAIIRIVLERIPATKVLSELLAGRIPSLK